MFRNVRLAKIGIALLCAAMPIAVVPALASSPNGPPTAPPGWHADLAPPAGALADVQIVSLPAATCATMDLPVNASCQLVHYSWGVNHQPLPAGTGVAGRSLFSDHVALAQTVPAGYWYWSWWDEWCSIYGCWYLSFVNSEDGIANGAAIYKWSHGCTAGGLNSSITWCGALYNGGGYPYYAMQFGQNGEQCLIARQGTLCSAHGIRRWISDSGYAGGLSWW